MKPFMLYKHDNCSDMAVMPLKNPFFIPQKDGYKVRVMYWNVVNHKRFFAFNILQTIFIKREDMAKWKFHGNPHAKHE